MSDFEEIPDWYDEDKKDDDFDPEDPTILDLPIPKRAKSQPAKKAPAKKRKKSSKTQPSDDEEENSRVPSRKTDITKTQIMDTLKSTFGHSGFRSSIQENAIEMLCLGQCFKIF